MTNIQTIMEALLIEATPNTPAQYSEDRVMYEKELLLSLIEDRLQGEPAARDLTQRYLEAPAVWEGALVDALESADVLQDDRIIDQAQKVMKVAESIQPRRGQLAAEETADLPSTLPGVLADES